MPIRTFRAPTMRDALTLVRNELGPDAVILNTRTVRARRRLPWRKPAEETEVTVGLAEEWPAATTAADTATSPPLPQAVALPQNQNAEPSTPEPSTPEPSAHEPSGHEPSGLDYSAGIAALLASLGGRTFSGRTDVPDELFHLYARLLDSDVDNDHARDLIYELQRQLRPHELTDSGITHARLAELIESQIRCSGPIVPRRDRRRVVALVGPTGVGKTTTVAKLAANFRLRDGIRLGLVTVDTYRVAAVEQLRTYADIIDLPMKVVTSPREMQRAVSELAGMDLVLIDTAGRSPRDELKIQELKSFLAEADVDEVHLVLSLAASPRSLEAAAERFKAVGTTSLLLTKLDEAPGVGAVLSAARRIDLPISYFTTGQDVPDDIEPATPSRASRLILDQGRPL